MLERAVADEALPLWDDEPEEPDTEPDITRDDDERFGA